MKNILLLNHIFAYIFMVCYSYHGIFVLVGMFFKPRRFPEAPPRKYAVLIAARNEEAVIAQLIQSIRAQRYPAELLRIFVVADNCTDRTEEVARAAGAVVWARTDLQRCGKGYALQFLFRQILDYHRQENFDGYFIFDADNLLDENYVAEMNKTFAAGYRIITSYRNSKNFGSSWISAGYSLWFIREARYLNNARMILGTSCGVSGTGYLIHRDIIEANRGWHYFLLTEDIEFSVDMVLRGERIGYCADAVFYDEQPVGFAQSFRQRLRWAKGSLQVFAQYGGALARGSLLSRSFACYDMIMCTLPVVFLTLVAVVLNTGMAVLSLLNRDGQLLMLWPSLWRGARDGYLMMFAYGLLTVSTEWKRIYASPAKKMLYLLSFPLYVFTYMPISLVAVFLKIEWKPIHHTVSKTLEDVRDSVQR